MGKIRYPDSPEQRDRLRDTMRRQGHGSVDEIAAAFRERWAYSHLRSYRAVLDLSQEKVCAEVNKLLGVHAGDDGYFDHSTLSKIERWPYSGRRPTISQLVALATIYGTTPRHLIAPTDLDQYPPADRLALTTLDHGMAPAGPTTNPVTAGMMEEARPQTQALAHSQHTPWERPELGPGDPTERLAIMTGDETAQRYDHPTQAGQATIEQLRIDATELSRKFPTTSRLELLGGTRLLRDRVFHYLDGRLMAAEHRDVCFLAAAACGMLIPISDDLGYPGPAMSHARAALMFAKESGSSALEAWVYANMANVCYWNGRPNKARDYAREGRSFNPTGTVSVFLPAIEARACGDLHDAEATQGAINATTEAREHVQHGELDDFGYAMSFDLAKQHFYAGCAYLGAHDFSSAVTEVNASISEYEAEAPEDRSYNNMSIARLQAAIASIRAGDLDAAAGYGRSGLSVLPEHRNTQVDKSAKRLHRQLCASAVRTSQLAIEVRDEIEDFLSVSSGRLEIS